MKNYIIIIFVSFVASQLLSSCNNYDEINCSICEKEIKQRFPTEVTSDPDNYLLDCKTEYKTKVEFPRDKPVYAKMYFDSFLKSPKALRGKQLSQTLKTLNDSSSYIWGEIGTPHFDRHIFFYDKTGWCIGMTKLSFEGQTYSTPSLARMKWGMLNRNSLSDLMKILEETE